MSSKYGLLSFLVLGLVVLLIFKNYEIWTQPVEWVPDENIGKRPQSKPGNRPEVLSTFGTQKNPTSVKSNISIAEKNVFSPERKDFPVPAGNGKKQLVRPQVILYGVTMVGDYQAASVANPGRPLQKGERETFTVKKGERIGEYKLTKVSSDRVTLEAEGDTFEVLLYDQSMPKRRSEIRTEIKPTTITSTQPAPPSPAVPGSPLPTPPTPSTVVPRPTPPVGGQERMVTPAPPIPPPSSPTLPSPGFPRRRPYYPPPGTSQKPEGN
jgi:hypothetical protein